MKITILPPKNCNPDEIKSEYKEIQHGFVVISTYPNGVEVVYTWMNGNVNATSSRSLIKIDDHTYQVPD